MEGSTVTSGFSHEIYTAIVCIHKVPFPKIFQSLPEVEYFYVP